ncbi:hypothetical protein JCM3766R1_003528 [Sporobolomyces carnicolor]
MSQYRFPRSQRSLDLTTTTSHEQQRPSPTLVITNATAQDDLPHLDRMTLATRTLLSSSSSSSKNDNNQHLSINALNEKTLSRISEYSESAYSADDAASHSRSRPNSHEPTTSTTRTTSFAFPGAPSPPRSHPTAPLPPVPATVRDVVSPSPSPWAYPTLPGSPSRSHLPSRPITALTTPLPSANPNPVPVPISNFAPTAHHDHMMVQIPGRAATRPAGVDHSSQPSDSTLTSSSRRHNDGGRPYADDDDAKRYYYNEKDGFGDAYDAVSIAPSSLIESTNNRFTLDHHPNDDDDERRRHGDDDDDKSSNYKSPSRLGHVLPKRGANRKLFVIVLTVVVVVAIALGTGLGLGLKNLTSSRARQGGGDDDDGVVGVVGGNESSSSSLGGGKSILLPTETETPSSSSSVVRTGGGPSVALVNDQVFSTTFGYRVGSATTVVPLSYTIPTSYFTRDDGRIQFTQDVVLPSLAVDGGSFTSELRFRVPAPTTSTTTTTRNRVKRGQGGTPRHYRHDGNDKRVTFSHRRRNHHLGRN